MGDDGRENLPRRRRSDETRSRRSIKETKTIPYLMGDEAARENRKEARRTESRSMKETNTKEKNESDDKEMMQGQKRNLDREKSEHKTIVDERIRRGYPRCKFFLRGACKVGSACKFIHEKNNEDSRLPMRQSSRRHETAWKEENETRDWVIDIEMKYNRSLSQICDGIVAGYKRDQMEKEHRQRENTKGHRRESQESAKEHRQRDNTKGQRREAEEHVWEQRQRENSKGQRREAKESVKEHRQREKNTKGQRDFEKEKNAQEQRLMGIAENHKLDAHCQEDNLHVERQRKSIEWQTRREAQEMERKKSKAFLEEKRSRDKFDKKRQRDVDKLEVEDEESYEGQRLKAKAIPDSKGLERFKDISPTHDEIVGGDKRARKMVKKFEESDQRLKEKKHAHDQTK